MLRYQSRKELLLVFILENKQETKTIKIPRRKLEKRDYINALECVLRVENKEIRKEIV